MTVKDHKEDEEQEMKRRSSGEEKEEKQKKEVVGEGGGHFSFKMCDREQGKRAEEKGVKEEKIKEVTAILGGAEEMKLRGE